MPSPVSLAMALNTLLATNIAPSDQERLLRVTITAGLSPAIVVRHPAPMLDV